MIWLTLFVVLASSLSLLRLNRDPRADREFWIQVGFAVLNFGLFAFVGALFMLLMVQPHRPRWHSLLLFSFLFSWVAYGLVWLIRAGPNFEEPPAWIARRGTWLDVTLGGLTAAFALGAILL